VSLAVYCGLCLDNIGYCLEMKTGSKTVVLMKCGHLMLSNTYEKPIHRAMDISCCLCNDWCYSDCITPKHPGYKPGMRHNTPR